MAISEWTDQNLAEVIIIGGMVFCALSVRFTMFSFISSESLLFALEGRARRIFYMIFDYVKSLRTERV